MWNLENGTDEPTCRERMETWTQRTNLQTQQGTETVGRMKKVALMYILTAVCEIAS